MILSTPNPFRSFVTLFIGALLLLCMLFTFKASAGSNNIPPVPGLIMGEVNVCMYAGTPQSVRYTIDAVPGAEVYLWLAPPTATILSGQGTTSITVGFSSGFVSAANKQIRVRAISDAGNSADRILYLIAQQPSTPASIVGPTNACIFMGTPDLATYTTARIAAASGFIWGLPEGATATHPNGPGAGDTIIKVSFKPGYKSGLITVQAFNACGFSASRVLSVSGVAPATPGPITGPTNGCAYMLPAGNIATYFISPVAGATSYTWATPANCIVEHVNQPGASDTRITVQYPVNFTGGVISVKANSGCDESAARNLVINKLNPSMPGAITPTLVINCPTREFTYSLPAMPSNTTAINWTVPPDAIGFSGQGTTSITVLYPEPRVTGRITATATNNCATSGQRILPVNLNRCQQERTASSYGRGGENSQAPESIGVKPVTDDGGFFVSVSPNPATTHFKVQIKSADKSIIKVRLLDLQGREIKKMTTAGTASLIFGSELQPGSYVLEIIQGNQKHTEQLLKL